MEKIKIIIKKKKKKKKRTVEQTRIQKLARINTEISCIINMAWQVCSKDGLLQKNGTWGAMSGEDGREESAMKLSLHLESSLPGRNCLK